MQTFNYKAFDRGGKALRGRVEARDARAARGMLASSGLNVVSVVPAKGGRAASSRLLDVVFARRLRALSFLFHSLSVLTESGCPLSESLGLALQGEDGADGYRRTLSPVISRVRDAVEGGSTLASAFAGSGAGLSSAHAAMLEYGEKSGSLGAALEGVGADLAREAEWRKRILGVCAYPAGVTCFAAAVLMFQAFYVMPSYVEVYARMGVPVPVFLRALPELRENAAAAFAIMACLAGVFFISRRRVFSWLRALVLRVPVARRVAMAVFKRDLFHALSVMTASGVPFVSALGCVVGGLRPGPRRDAMAAVGRAVSEGAPLATAFASCGLFSELETRMLRLAGDGGDMAGALKMIEKKNEEVFNDTVEGCLGLIEPALTVLVGLAVALAALAFVLPVYYLSDGLGN